MKQSPIKFDSVPCILRQQRLNAIYNLEEASVWPSGFLARVCGIESRCRQDIFGTQLTESLLLHYVHVPYHFPDKTEILLNRTWLKSQILPPSINFE